MGRRRRDEESDTREQILDEAERLIAEGGYDALRLKDIADAIEIQVPSIYGHFEGREGVIAGVALRYVEAMSDQFPYDRASDPTKALLEGLRQYVCLWLAHPAYLRLRLRDLEAPGRMPELDSAKGGTLVGNPNKGVLAPMFQRLSAILEDGHSRGEFRKIEMIRFWRDMTGATLAALTYPTLDVLLGKASRQEAEELVSEIQDLALRLLRPD